MWMGRIQAEKAREQQERYLYRSQYVEHLRENWARVANRHLERTGTRPVSITAPISARG